MAITIPPKGGDGSTNPVIATDDVAGVHYQKFRLDAGGQTLGTGQEDMDDSIPVVIASDQSAIEVTSGAANDIFNLLEGINTDLGAVIGASQEVMGLVKAEDAAAANGDKGVPVLGVRRDTSSSGIGADGDYASLGVNAHGQLWVHDPDANELLQELAAALSSWGMGGNNHWSVFTTYSEDVSGDTLKEAPGEGLSLYITDILISSSTTATANSAVLLQSSSDVTVFASFIGAYDKVSMTFRTAIKLPANTDLEFASDGLESVHTVVVCGFTAP